MYQKTSQGESSSPWPDSLKDSAQGWIPKSGSLPWGGGAGRVQEGVSSPDTEPLLSTEGG